MPGVRIHIGVSSYCTYVKHATKRTTPRLTSSSSRESIEETQALTPQKHTTAVFKTSRSYFHRLELHIAACIFLAPYCLASVPKRCSNTSSSSCTFSLQAACTSLTTCCDSVHPSGRKRVRSCVLTGDSQTVASSVLHGSTSFWINRNCLANRASLASRPNLDPLPGLPWGRPTEGFILIWHSLYSLSVCTLSDTTSSGTSSVSLKPQSE